MTRAQGDLGMYVILLMFVTFAGYLLAYHTYGRFLSRRVFRLRPDAPVPSVESADGVDFVPTRRGIIFGHHYTSIAGTGPIVGPAIGVIWGWLPALIWVFAGSVLLGAVHDFGALVLSLRNEGKSLAEVAARLVGPRIRYVFFAVIFLELLIVIAVFCLVIAVIFNLFPESVFPVWAQLPIAVALGWLIYRRNAPVTWTTAAAVALMYVTIVAGRFAPLRMPDIGNMPATGTWALVLLGYAFAASVLPVNRLLQPRDYINAWQLMVATGLLMAGVIASGTGAGLRMVAPAFNPSPAGAPPLVPFLFITIACGAISGFHCLVASGTTSKQIAKETDALFVGYGSMLMEGALAVLVIIAVCAGIGMAYPAAGGETLSGTAAWNRHYASWEASEGLASMIHAVVAGSANMMASLHIPRSLGVAVIGVFIASFAGTTLDSATRIQRYVVAELFSHTGLTFLTRRHAATAFAVLTAAGLAFATGAHGRGALMLWPMFGAVNQLLAALALLVITIYLRGRGGSAWLLTAVPFGIMLVITLWATGLNEARFIRESNLWPALINGAVLLLALWMVVEGCMVLLRPARKTAGS